MAVRPVWTDCITKYTLLNLQSIGKGRNLQHVQQGGLRSSNFLILLDQVHIILWNNITKNPLVKEHPTE